MAYTLLAFVEETPLGYSHPLWLYGSRFQGYTILVNEDEHGVEYAEAFVEPDDQTVGQAKRAYIGGSKYTISDLEAIPLIAAGFSDWLTPVVP